MSTQAGIPLMAADADGTPFAIFQELVEKNGGSISKAPADQKWPNPKVWR